MKKIASLLVLLSLSLFSIGCTKDETTDTTDDTTGTTDSADGEAADSADGAG